MCRCCRRAIRLFLPVFAHPADRREATLSSDPEIGGKRQACPCPVAVLPALPGKSGRIWPAVRVSCQTIALCTGLPVAFSQTTVVSRWLVIPMAAISPGALLARAIASRDNAPGPGPDFQRIVFYPARLRINLRKFFLRNG